MMRLRLTAGMASRPQPGVVSLAGRIYPDINAGNIDRARKGPLCIISSLHGKRSMCVVVVRRNESVPFPYPGNMGRARPRTLDRKDLGRPIWDYCSSAPSLDPETSCPFVSVKSEMNSCVGNATRNNPRSPVTPIPFSLTLIPKYRTHRPTSIRKKGDRKQIPVPAYMHSVPFRWNQSRE